VQHDEENDQDKNQGSGTSAAEKTDPKEEAQGATAGRTGCNPPRPIFRGGPDAAIKAVRAGIRGGPTKIREQTCEGESDESARRDDANSGNLQRGDEFGRGG
jgi:hypothetical protein